MIKKGIVNGQLLKELALVGDKEFFMVQGIGMPTPQGVPVIDLALIPGLPDMRTCLQAIVETSPMDNYIIPEDLSQKDEKLYKEVTQIMGETKSETMSGIMLREFVKKCKFIVRTGDTNPLAVIALQAGQS